MREEEELIYVPFPGSFDMGRIKGEPTRLFFFLPCMPHSYCSDVPTAKTTQK